MPRKLIYEDKKLTGTYHWSEVIDKKFETICEARIDSLFSIPFDKLQIIDFYRVVSEPHIEVEVFAQMQEYKIGNNGKKATNYDNYQIIRLDYKYLLEWQARFFKPLGGSRNLIQKVLIDIKEESLKILEEKRQEEGNNGTDEIKEIYTLNKCADETGFDQSELERWVQTINRKKQVILYGSPGTGKTYIAERIARHLIADGDGFKEFVQFHPAYYYEDFIQGIRPQSQDGDLKYPLVPGRFLEFCKKAKYRKGLCVLIIDEINRANLAQVFGELMYLLEYRDKKIPLAGSSELFCIPENVRIIGTMNTADRSIALVDHALRRRFAFIELRPNYEVLRRYHENKETGFQVDGLIETLKRLNNAIANKHYELGISFFLTENLAEHIEDIWKMEIEPYLEEYFYDQLKKVDDFRWDKIKQQVLPS